MPRSMDLASIVVLFKVIESPADADILTLAENDRFLLNLAEINGHTKRILQLSMGDIDQKESLRDVLAFRFRENIHAPRGWVVGSAEADECDLKLAKSNHTGISRFHFCIDISPKNRPRITNLGKNDIYIHGSDPTEIAALGADDFMDIDEPIIIDLGVALLRMWRPILTSEEQAKFIKNAMAFNEDYMQAVPKPARSNADPTSDVRFGLRNTVYRKVQQEKPRTGSFGSVVKVMEMRSGAFFAAKMPHVDFRRSIGADRQNWELIQREFRSLTELQHVTLPPSHLQILFIANARQENIVRTIETLPGNRDTQLPWLVMEWMEDSLSTYSPSVYETPDILRQVSTGLSYMHEKGFTHRDIKPGNILIRRNGPMPVVKIADVGFTNNAGARHMYTFSGTLLYMAPELWESQKGYSNAVDLWSLGIVALEILTKGAIFDDAPSHHGRPPSESEYLRWIQTEVLPRRDHDPWYSPLLHALLSEQGNARWTARQCEGWLQRYCGEAGPRGIARSRGRG